MSTARRRVRRPGTGGCPRRSPTSPISRPPAARGASPATRSAGLRLPCSARYADRRALRIGRRARLLVRVLPAEDRGGRDELLARALEELRPLDPAFVSVTYGAGGSTKDKTLELVSRVRDEFGLEAMPHFT